MGSPSPPSSPFLTTVSLVREKDSHCQSFSCLFSHSFCPSYHRVAALGMRLAWGRARREKRNSFPFLLCVKGPPSTPQTREGSSWSSCCPWPGCSSVICAATRSRRKIQKAKTKNQEVLTVYSLGSGFLSQSTCYHLLLRVLKQLLYAFCPEILVAFGERDRVEYTYHILPRTETPNR